MIEESYAECAANCGAKLDTRVRRNPGLSLCAAAGFGFLAAMIFRALRPPKPRHRVQALLEEIQERVHELGVPALRRAGAFAADSAHTLRDGAHHSEAQLERVLRKAARRLRGAWA